jgi:hypothetical protein
MNKRCAVRVATYHSTRRSYDSTSRYSWVSWVPDSKLILQASRAKLGSPQHFSRCGLPPGMAIGFLGVSSTLTGNNPWGKRASCGIQPFAGSQVLVPSGIQNISAFHPPAMHQCLLPPPIRPLSRSRPIHCSANRPALRESDGAGHWVVETCTDRPLNPFSSIRESSIIPSLSLNCTFHPRQTLAQVFEYSVSTVSCSFTSKIATPIIIVVVHRPLYTLHISCTYAASGTLPLPRMTSHRRHPICPEYCP